MDNAKENEGQINRALLIDPASAEEVAKLTLLAVKLCGEVDELTLVAEKTHTKAVQRAKECGEVLLKIKPMIAPGQWMQWVEYNFAKGQTTANKCMRIWGMEGTLLIIGFLVRPASGTEHRVKDEPLRHPVYPIFAAERLSPVQGQYTQLPDTSGRADSVLVGGRRQTGHDGVLLLEAVRKPPLSLWERGRG